jgi:hypothetical protein
VKHAVTPSLVLVVLEACMMKGLERQSSSKHAPTAPAGAASAGARARGAASAAPPPCGAPGLPHAQGPDIKLARASSGASPSASSAGSVARQPIAV